MAGYPGDLKDQFLEKTKEAGNKMKNRQVRMRGPIIGVNHWNKGDCHQLRGKAPGFGHPCPSLGLSGEPDCGMSQLLYRPLILGRHPLESGELVPAKVSQKFGG